MNFLKCLGYHRERGNSVGKSENQDVEKQITEGRAIQLENGEPKGFGRKLIIRKTLPGENAIDDDQWRK